MALIRQRGTILYEPVMHPHTCTLRSDWLKQTMIAPIGLRAKRAQKAPLEWVLLHRALKNLLKGEFCALLPRKG